jgi:hypothetical protein
MTPRTPSRVPFVTVFLAALALQAIVPRAVLDSNAYWAGGLILGSLLLASASMLIGGGPGYSSTLSAVLWLIPALILTYNNSLLALLCLVPMLAGLNRFLPRTEAPEARGPIAALLIHAAIAIHLSAPPVLALVPAALGIALILWAREMPAKPRDFRIVSGAIAAMLTLFLLRPAPPLMPGSSVRATTLMAPPKELNAGSTTNAHLGIVFRPKAETRDHKLPPPPKLQPESARVIPKIPMEIPFSGVYWMFQTPLIRPPANSPVLEESPLDGDFSSDDKTPIRLDAHQTFNQPFPLGRIESIGVTLASQDKYPTTLFLELIASSSNSPEYKFEVGGGPMVKAELGQLPVDTLASIQTLRFKVPASPSIDQFDRLTLRFYLKIPRQQIAPRVAIQKFTIYPR